MILFIKNFIRLSLLKSIDRITSEVTYYMGIFNFKKKKIKKKREQLCREAEIFIQVHFVRESPTDEKHRYNTLALKSDPDREACAEWYASHNNPQAFSDIVMAYLKYTDKNEAVLCEKYQLDKNFFSNLRSDKKYHPSKGEAIIIAFAFRLNLEETKALLKSAEHSLSNSSKSDLIIRFFIDKKEYSLGDLNYVLDKFCEVKVRDLV